MEIIDYISHVRNRDYMSGVERDSHRIKVTAEIFTKTELVIEILDKIEITQPDIFINQDKTFIDNSCGDGQFLSEVVIRKIERSGCSLEQALKTTYGVELMEDNVYECRRRLSGPNPTQEIIEIVNKNIVCHDALTYNYSFE
ncbi:hypothetical protein UFOVP117_121 [uncultured Caudovirales phage]|jgi:hypothetical protein|uniref:Uncharacterized protein n=1 Tax=uncultured Caudovirales phage TaxID=2100421 RepID=A0A6J5L8S1_9CAUD|nr:hypothetical protein UFOVP117_121 [uncultured Caudovirales phage]